MRSNKFCVLVSILSVFVLFATYNNNINDNVYGAVIVAQSHCKSSSGSCDECGTAPSGRRPSDQAKRPGLWVRLPEATPTITIYYYYSAPKADTHFTIPRRVEDWVDQGTAVRVCSPCRRLYIVVVFMINTQLPTVGFKPWSSHTAARHITTRPLRPATELLIFKSLCLLFLLLLCYSVKRMQFGQVQNRLQDSHSRPLLVACQLSWLIIFLWASMLTSSTQC